MGDDHAIGMSLPSEPLNVGNKGRRSNANATTDAMRTPTEIHVFSEHEVLLIKASKPLERFSTNHKKCTGDPVHSPVGSSDV